MIPAEQNEFCRKWGRWRASLKDMSATPVLPRNRLVLQTYFMVLGVFLEGGRRMGWKDSIIRLLYNFSSSKQRLILRKIMQMFLKLAGKRRKHKRFLFWVKPRGWWAPSAVFTPQKREPKAEDTRARQAKETWNDLLPPRLQWTLWACKEVTVDNNSQWIFLPQICLEKSAISDTRYFTG